MLTGGGALLHGMTEIAEQVFDAPVRIGYPERDRFGGLVEDIQSPAWTAAAGLALLAHRTQAAEIRTGVSRRGSTGKLTHFVSRFEIDSVVFSDKLLYACAPVAQDIVRKISMPMAQATQHRRKRPWKPSRFGREELTMTPDTRQPGTGINIFIDDDPPITGARIKVIGIGGGGGNAVNRMIEAGIEGIEFLVANTDLQALKRSRAPIKIQLGSRLTKGLGAGADPGVGREAALEDTDKIIEVLEGADMVFVTTGLGGGTGTGAAPIIASLATELEALTVAVVTKPFHFEGRRRMQQADQGLRELRECVDTVITIPNERLLHTVDRSFTC